MNSDSLLPFGIYETPVTARIQERIEEIVDVYGPILQD